MSQKTPPLRSRIKEATNQEILQAAESVLAENGVVGTTMAMVAQKAGVSVGTLYNYFADRDELLRVLHKTRREQFYERLTELIEETKGQPFADRLEQVVQMFAAKYESKSHRDFMRIVFSGEMPLALCGGRPPVLDFAERLSPLLEDGIQEKALIPGDVMFYAGALASVIRGMIIMAVSEDKPINDMVPVVTSLFLNGIGRRK